MESVSTTDTESAINSFQAKNEALKLDIAATKARVEKVLQDVKFNERLKMRPEKADSQMVSLQTKINTLKKEANSLRTEISANGYDEIPDLENKIKYLKNQLANLDKEKETLLEVRLKQEERLEFLAIPEALAIQANSLKEEIKESKKEYREFRAKFLSDSHKWQNMHENWVQLETKLKSHTRRYLSPHKLSEQSENSELTELNKKQKIINKAISGDEIKMKRLITDEQQRLENLKKEDSQIKKKIAEKDQVLQLKNIKLKELRSLYKILSLDVNHKKSITVEPDTDTFVTSVKSMSLGAKTTPSVNSTPTLKLQLYGEDADQIINKAQENFKNSKIFSKPDLNLKRTSK